MKILVTGGAGFIGANFILYWLGHHSEDYIENMDKLTYAGNLENLVSVEKNPRYKFIHLDICNKTELRKNFADYDLVVHFAAETHVDRSIIKADGFIDTNIIGTYNLLEICRERKIKHFHHVSTDEVFGQLELNSSDKFNEKTNYNPRSPYSASKAASDHIVRAFYYTYGLPVTISNCSNNYGQYQFPEKFIPLSITNLLEDKKVPVYGDGLYVRDWLYVVDHCRAIEAVVTKGKIGETYCVGGLTEDISNIEIVKKILLIMHKSDNMIEFVKDRPGHDRKYAMDWTKIKNELSWVPEHDFDTYLKQTIDWYIHNQDWWRKIKSGEYQKYYQQQYGVKL
jgi:dTDP-glucose 4,6-dehydratase